ncbi:NAD-dependent epimerase/dehydratase family protein [Frondihabitans australicus]|uniref:Nucleoside-diphosphate-sugar epimerase n=1 Tax=Frondihabitans australicus TaxID=386892 RepID=A0A495IHS5_9MICO|nr:NAD-dependent epimerase/dehydratase family protein [Frondihabitans australicus]RKR74665.1 nucleoside-diphosphate-sugar epimerase [Frondihabitans australicus]
MKVVVIGATGHVGSYLVPRLVRAGHEVTAVTRGTSEPYHQDPAWRQVTRVTLDRDQGDADGTFAPAIAALGADAVIDMVCFTVPSAQQLVDALRGTGAVLLHCGTIWVHGPATEVPITEDAVRTPFGEYGTQKAAIEELLVAETRRGGVRSVILHPGHITGPGWPMINPQGNLDLGVWAALAAGDEVVLPNLGLETLHHVHADDVAQGFERALARHAVAAGQSFHLVSERAVTLRGLAEGIAAWYGAVPSLRYVPLDALADEIGSALAETTRDHISRSHSCSIERARTVLGYAPRYTSLEAIEDGLAWLAADGQVPAPVA